MPELPDLQQYLEALEERIVGELLLGVKLKSLFVLRSTTPRPEACVGRRVVGLERLGKRIVLVFEEEHFMLLHLMVAGRLQWKDVEAQPQGRIGLAAFRFSSGTLLFNEAGKRKRASLHIVATRAQLAQYDRCALEPLTASFEDFKRALGRERHTLKRALTDPGILSGVGNAYSDEILWQAGMSPFKRTDKLSEDEFRSLHSACQKVLRDWIERLRKKRGKAWPGKVTAFQPEMAVHGRWREACPRCGEEVQRVVWAENEANYCARCQCAGRLLADRALSRLLKDDWPRSLEELESLRERHRSVVRGEPEPEPE